MVLLSANESYPFYFGASADLPGKDAVLGQKKNKTSKTFDKCLPPLIGGGARRAEGATLTDHKLPHTTNNQTIDYYLTDITSAQDYYPFGMLMPNRSFSPDKYRFGFNGKENDNEIAGTGNSQDFGARMYDNRLGRWKSCDPLGSKYPSISPFTFALNTPIQAYDPDGRLVLFAHGFLLGDGLTNKPSSGQGELIYKNDYNAYWEGIDNMFMHRTGDYNVRYFNGEHSSNSQASDRMEEGRTAARNLHAQILSGEVQLKKNDAGEIIETIQIVGHSQGAAYAAGMAEELVKLNYKVENVYYLAPHQPADIINPEGVRGVQFSHPEDRVSSKSMLPNGGSKLGKIQGVSDENYQVYQDPSWDMTLFKSKLFGWNGDRGGHNVGLHTYIFNNTCTGSGGNVSPSSSPGSVVGGLNPGGQEIKLSGSGYSYTWQ